jgi:tetratricopeptide (TPR) repeat protein
LAQLRSLRVTARNTAFRYKGRDTDLQKVGQDLGVSAVVTGRVLQRGDTLIVQTELVETQKGSQLWGQQYNRKLSDVLALQEDISRQISDNLRLHLTGEEKQQLARRYTDNAEAYQLYLKGQYYYNKRTKEATLKAIGQYQQAIEKDPSYALAYTGLSEAYSVQAIYWFPPHEVMPKAKTAAQKAIELDANLAEAYAALAYVTLYYDWDWPNARKYFEKSMALDPANATARYLHTVFFNAVGSWEEGIAEARRALELDPLSLPNNFLLGATYYYWRRYDEAIEQGRKTVEMDTNFPLGHYILGRTYLAKGLNREALAEFQKEQDLSPNTNHLGYLGYCYPGLGERSKTQKLVEELKARSGKEYVPAYVYAILYLGLEDRDRAFAAMEQAVQERSTTLVLINRDSTWDPIRSDPRFADLVRKVGLPQ